MKPLSSDLSYNNRWDIIKFYLSDRCRCDRWRVDSMWSLNFFFLAITAIVAIIWKLGVIYRNNHPPYLYALQTYRTHSSKLRLLLVIKVSFMCEVTSKYINRLLSSYCTDFPFFVLWLYPFLSHEASSGKKMYPLIKLANLILIIGTLLHKKILLYWKSFAIRDT